MDTNFPYSPVIRRRCNWVKFVFSFGPGRQLHASNSAYFHNPCGSRCFCGSRGGPTRMPALTPVVPGIVCSMHPADRLPAHRCPLQACAPLLAENLSVLPASEGLSGRGSTLRLGARYERAQSVQTVAKQVSICVCVTPSRTSPTSRARPSCTSRRASATGASSRPDLPAYRPRDDTIRVDSRTVSAELLGMYRCWDTGNAAGGMTLDLLAGVRYYRFRTKSCCSRRSTPVNKTTQWIDPVVGVRVGYQLWTTSAFSLAATSAASIG